MTDRSRDVARGATAVVALLLLLAGPPIALIRFVGWPLPTELPSIDQITLASRSGLDDMILVKVLAVLAWVAWVQLALAAVAEITALVRGRAARRAPVLPIFQHGVARL